MIKGDEQVAVLDASISILAPMNMPGGYEFFADAGNGSSYKVRVVRFGFWANALTATVDEGSRQTHQKSALGLMTMSGRPPSCLQLVMARCWPLIVIIGEATPCDTFGTL
jgi:hypothetical protein